MDCPIGTTQAIHLRGAGACHYSGHPARADAHAHGHFPGNQHPRREHCLDLYGALAARDGAARHLDHRTRRDDHGQRYRAPGVAIPSRHDHHQALFSSASQYLYGAGANGRRHRDDDEVASAGRHSTARDHLLRFDRSGHSNRTHQRHHERAGAVRPRHHLSSSQVHHRARRGHSLAVRWKAAFHLGGYRFRGFAIEGPLSRGYRERHEPAEPHLADGNRKARPAGVQRGDEREPAHRGGAQRSAGQKRER